MVATPQDADGWSRTARRVSDLGYSTLLMPDGLQLPATLPALAVAATAAPGLRVAPFVMASPLHPPGLLAWEAHSLTQLTGGRFDLGIGTGIPNSVEGAAKLFGEPPLTAPERLRRVEETIDRLRELDGDAHTPIMVAASGPRALALAGRKADIVAIAGGALATREEVQGSVDLVRQAAGPRADAIELSLHLFAVGDGPVPPGIERFLGIDVAAMRQSQSMAQLSGSVGDMVDELERRRERLGTTYITVLEAFAEALAPVVGRLAGR